MRVFVFLLISYALMLILSGCSLKAVYVPTKCSASMPSAPLHTKDSLENLKNLATYAQKLECTLDFCINGKANLEQCQ